MTSLAEHRRQVDGLLARRRRACERVREEKAALSSAKGHLARCREAQALVQATAADVQNRVHRQVAGVVTRCLRAVFGEDAYEFQIRFSRKRGRTEAELLFQRGGLVVDPTTAAGGGAVGVAAFALRLACLLLARPRRRLFLALDEPFSHLSASYRPGVARLLETLCGELGLQVLLVTHDQEFMIGKVVRL